MCIRHDFQYLQSGGQRPSKVTAQFEVTLNGCDTSRQCRQSYDVYIWQTSTINRTAARNTDNYMYIERISPDNTDGFGSSTNLVEIDLNSEDGFYLAVVDFSTCLTDCQSYFSILLCVS